VGDPPEDGAASAGYLAGLRKAGATLTGKLRARREDGGQPDQPGQLVALSVAELSESGRTALVTGLVLGSHRVRGSHPQPPPPRRVELVVPEAELAEAGRQIAVAGALAAATALARDLANVPSDVKTPTWLVETAARLADDREGLSATVWPVERLAAEGFGGILAVGGGSARPPAMLRLDWSPAGGPPADRRHLVLVGKGITFDTG